MAKNFIWDYKAAGDLMLRSNEIAEICEEEAEKMTRATGMDYTTDIHVGKKRVNAAGRKKAEKDSEKTDVCPKCGSWHPNCKCRTRGA